MNNIKLIIIAVFIFSTNSVFSKDQADTNNSFLKLFDSIGIQLPECMDISFEYNGNEIERLNFDRNRHKTIPCNNDFSIEFISIGNSFRYDNELENIENKVQAFNVKVRVAVAEEVHIKDSISIFIVKKADPGDNNNLHIEILMADNSNTGFENEHCDLIKKLFNKNIKKYHHILSELKCVQ